MTIRKPIFTCPTISINQSSIIFNIIRPLNTALLLTLIFIKQEVNGQNFPDYKNHIENVMNLYKESFNSNDFVKLEPYVIKEFSAGEMEPHHAQQFIRAKINSEKESNIQDFGKFKFKKLNEEIVLKFVEEYENGKKKKLTFRFILDETWKINDFSFQFLTNNGSFTGTLVSHEITNPTTGLTKKIYDKNTYLNLSQFNKIEKNGYAVFYEEELKSLADTTIQIILKIDEIIQNQMGTDFKYREHILLTKKKGPFTTDAHMNQGVWSISVNNDPWEDSSQFTNTLFCVFPHELTEGILIQTYKVAKNETRWFRDGMAEFTVYQVAQKISHPTIERHINLRKMEYEHYKGNENILDWRAKQEIPEYGALPIGNEYHFLDQKKPYGRSLQFFIDLSEEYQLKIISDIYKELRKKKNVSNKDIIDIINQLTKSTIQKKISTY